MNAPAYSSIARDGLWTNNPIFVQLLGLCPMLAVSNTAVNALGLGLATIFVLIASNVAISLIRNVVRGEIRIAMFVLIIATFVTVVELLMRAYLFDLYKALGIFVALIVTNCNIVGRAEAFASRQPVDRAALDGLMMGLGFTLVLVLLGALREVVSQGTLFANAHLMLGAWAHHLTTTVIPDYRGFLLAALPPGAFIGLGFLIAVKNVIDRRRQVRIVSAPEPAPVV